MKTFVNWQTIMAVKYGLKILFLLAFGSVCFSGESTSGVLSTSENLDGSSSILSRRKRYLVFPDGSSFQLVFCTQNHGYLQIGDIVWFGNTAALAWELPTDPKLFFSLKNHKEFSEAQNRNDPARHVYYLDEDGKVLSKVPYKKKFIVNPAFSKRSINDEIDTMYIKEMHVKQSRSNHLQDLDKDSIEFHRNGRVSFFSKLEKMLEGLGFGGRDCVLRALCEHGQGHTEQGTFLQEIIRATFTLPPGKKFADPDHQEYDKASNYESNCAHLYPHCTNLHGWFTSYI